MWHNLSFASDSKLKILFIFTPSQTQYEILLQQISQLQIQDTIYIDKTGNFLTENKDILKNYNAFLLNKRGEIVLVGDPIANKSMIELYRKTLDNMLANDGLYLDFDGVPDDALLLLQCTTTGTESRPFTYRDGEIEWY